MNSENLTICICGGGSLGIVCAGVFLSQGITVNLLTGHPQKWSKHIIVEDLHGKQYSGNLNTISNNPECVITGADIVLLCVPGYLIEKTLIDIQSHLKKDVLVGSIVSSTGFFFIAHKILSKKCTLFGFQRVPFISRQKEYGKIGELLGYKPLLNVVIENSDNIESVRLLIEKIFITPVKLLDNYYEVSLTNSNPILHTGRLYSMWKGEIKPVKNQIRFYAEWTVEASRYLINMDNEFQELLKNLGIKEGVIPTLLNYYESTDAESLTKKIKSISAFKPILAPMKKTSEGWVPDYESRYFTEDFPFGLKFIRNLAKENSVPCPTIDKVYEWGISKIK